MPCPLPAAGHRRRVQARTDVELTSEQKARAAMLIADVSTMARDRVPNLPNPPPATAPGVIRIAVLRALAHPPTGATSERTAGTPALPRTRAVAST